MFVLNATLVGFISWFVGGFAYFLCSVPFSWNVPRGGWLAGFSIHPLRTTRGLMSNRKVFRKHFEPHFKAFVILEEKCLSNVELRAPFLKFTMYVVWYVMRQWHLMANGEVIERKTWTIQGEPAQNRRGSFVSWSGSAKNLSKLLFTNCVGLSWAKLNSHKKKQSWKSDNRALRKET